MNPALAFIPEDRRHALVTDVDLPLRQVGTVLFADLSGSSRLTDTLIATLGTAQAIDQLTVLFNRCFTTLIAEIQRRHGAIISFGGDGFIATFPDDRGEAALSAAFAMQRVMAQFRVYELPDGQTARLALKITVAQGPFLRLCVGDPMIQRLELVLGDAVTAASTLQVAVEADQVLVDRRLASVFADRLAVAADEPQSLDSAGGVIATGWLDNELAPGHSQQSTELETNCFSPTEQTTINPDLVRQWLLGAVDERLGQSSIDFLGEIRPVTVLYLHITGWVRNADSEEQAALLQQTFNGCVQWIQRLLKKHGGNLLKLTFDDKGSYGLITFGAPKSANADTARALAAALALNVLPTLHPTITEVKMGLNRGRVLAGAFGAPNRAAYDLLGSAVNWGSRYMMAAGPGEILLSEAVAIDGVDAFQLEYRGTQLFKGMAQAQTVYVLRGHHPIAFTVPEQIVGRAHELAQLNGWLHCCHSGKGQIVIVEGPAGIGKSHLIGGFTRQAVDTGAVIAIGICDYVGRQISYYPWRNVIGQLIPMLDRNTLTPQQQALLTEFLEEQIQLARVPQATTLREPQRRQEALFALVSEIIVACADVQPLMLVIEDLYFCDQASMELLRVVSRLVPEHALLLVLVQHPNPANEQAPLVELRQQPYYHTLSIEELPATNIATIVAERLKGAAEPLLLDLIQHQSQGNPLYAEEFVLALRDLDRLDYVAATERYTINQELLATLRRANCLVREGGTGAWRLRPDAALSATDLGLPDILHELVNIRVDQLPNSLTITLYTAALLGQRFSQRLLTEAHLDQPAATFVKAQLTLLVEHALLLPSAGDGADEQYTFRHNLVQKVIYEKVPEQQRQILHRHIAEALQRLQPEAVEQLAFHFVRTDQTEQAVHYLETAARKSRDGFANEAALNFYEQVLRYEERLEWLVAKATLLHQLGEREKEEEMLELLVPHAGELSYSYAYLCAQFHEATGHYEAATLFAEQAQSLAEAQQDTVWSASSLLLQGLVARRQGHYDLALTRHKDGINRLDPSQITDAEVAAVLVALYIGVSNILRQQGKYEVARTYCHEALTLCHRWENRRGEADIMNTLGGIAYYLRDFVAARHYHQRALGLRRSAGELRGEGISLYGLALVDYEEGAYDQATARLEQASTILQAARDPWEEANTLNLLGVILYQLGDWTRANDALQAGLHLCEELDDQIGKGYILCNLGLLARDQGKEIAAERNLLMTDEIAESQHERNLHAMAISHLAILRVQQQRPEEAIALAKAAIQIRNKLDVRGLTTIDYTTIARAFQQLAQPVHAREAIVQALQLLDEFSAVGPEFPHWDYYFCYEILWWLGDEVQALVALQKAYTLLMQRANAIQDVQIRAAYLTAVPINQKIGEATKRHGLA